jgi:hypothetical protein
MTNDAAAILAAVLYWLTRRGRTAFNAMKLLLELVSTGI